MSKIAVHIVKDSTEFVPSPNPVTLSKQNSHSIEWHNDTQEQITITFGSATPFPPHLNPYSIAPGKSSHSGPIEGAAGSWSYKIEGTSGGATQNVVANVTANAAPVIIIQP